MKLYFVCHSFAEIVQLMLKYHFKVFMSVYMQCCCTTKKTESGYQANKAETVVSMQMRNKYMIQTTKLYFRFSELKLGSFTAIYHKQLVSQVDDLTQWKMSCIWEI